MQEVNVKIQAFVASYLPVFSVIFCAEGRADSRFCSDLNLIIMLNSIIKIGQKV